MIRSLSPALRALLLRHVLLASLFVAVSSIIGSLTGCGDDDPSPAKTVADGGDGSTTKPDASTADGDVPDTSTGDSSTATDAADGSDGAQLPALSVENVAVDEGSSGTTNLTFTVTLSAASSTAVTVDFATADGTATTSGTAVGGADYTAATGTLTFAPGDLTKDVTVVVTGDTVNEANETLSVTLSNAAGATISRATAEGTINNDDVAGTLSISDPIVTEGNSGTQQAAFTVTLSAASGQTVTVTYKTTDGTATGGSDFTAISDTTLTFNAGETSKVVNVEVTGDVAVEPNETFSVDLSNAVNATITKSAGTGTIQNDDGVTLPTLSVNDQSVSEGNTGTKTMTFTVTLSAASTQTVTVDFATADGTAVSTASGDFQATTGTLTFAPSEVTKTITVTISGDTADEGNEGFTVNLSNATNANISDAQGAGTIVDDDTPPTLSINDVSVAEGQAGSTALTFTVTLSAASGTAVTVSYATSDGTATAGGDLATGGQDYTAASGLVTFPAGSTTQNVTVQVAGDTLNEANETLTVTLSSPTNASIADATGTGTITNDDDLPNLVIDDAQVTEGNAGTAALTFTVSLAAPSGRTVTVNYASANATAVAPGDFTAVTGTLTFAPGETQKSITVNANGDTTAETNETFNVVLSAPSNAAVSDATGVGTITNDDGALPFLNIGNEALTEGNAGSQTMTFDVTLSAPSSGPVTVDYATEDNTATAGGTLASGGQDYVATNGTLTFAPGETLKTITITINGDIADESNENFRVVLSNPSTTAALQDDIGVGTINDNDATPTLSISNAADTEGNSGTKNLTFTVTLSAVSGRTVTVSYATGGGTATTTGLVVEGGTDYTPASDTLTFLPGETTKDITVSINGDTTFEGNQTFNVTLSSAVNASLADGTGVGTITNDDTVPIVTIADVSLAEGTPAANTSNTTTFSFVVTLSNPRASTVTVIYGTANGTATAGAASDYANTNGTLTFAPGETTKTINVAVRKDAAVEANETFVVNLNAAPGATLGDNQATGTILNDD